MITASSMTTLLASCRVSVLRPVLIRLMDRNGNQLATLTAWPSFVARCNSLRRCMQYSKRLWKDEQGASRSGILSQDRLCISCTEWVRIGLMVFFFSNQHPYSTSHPFLTAHAPSIHLGVFLLYCVAVYAKIMSQTQVEIENKWKEASYSVEMRD